MNVSASDNDSDIDFEYVILNNSVLENADFDFNIIETYYEYVVATMSTNTLETYPDIQKINDTIALSAKIINKSYNDLFNLKDELTSQTPLVILKFIGPAKQKWLTELEDNGVDFYSYLPYNSYLVRMPISLLDQVEQLDYVYYAHPYLSIYKYYSSNEISSAKIILWESEDSFEWINRMRNYGNVINFDYNSCICLAEA